MLLDCSLYDREEAPFFLPRIPPEEDDWVRPGPEPEHGIRIHAKAVGPDGVIRPFAVGVSAPRPANDGYVAEIRYEWKEPPVRLVRGETCADCYFSGIDYIESRLDADQLTLLGLWNEPIPLPIRPKS